MEIFHAFGIEWKLLAIQALNFAVALFILHRYAYKPVMAIIAKREAEIAAGVASAEYAKKEEARVNAEREVIILAAQEEGGKVADDLRKEGIQAQRHMLREAQEQSASMLAEARTAAEEERLFVLRQTEKEIARTALLAAEKILRGHTTHNA